MNLRAKDYTNRVLGVIKEKYGLRDKSEALDKFAELYGGDFVDEFIDKEVKDEVVREVIESCDRHIKKYGFRSMSVEELDRLCRGE
ncbi:MAG: DUF2683 family protein [Candidatus Diapherotrites archaeon]|nr:DUF2683 family protein [Candidatus Diapherotrites archaeon]